MNDPMEMPQTMSAPMTPETDLHIHTLASGHAFSTVAEIAREAARKQLKGIALTDHGPSLPGGPHLYHFHALRFIPEHLEGVRIFRGVEANIVGAGEIDIPPEVIEKLDVVMAGFHEDCCPPGDEECYTETLCTVLENPGVRIISHPGNPNFPLDFETIARKAAETTTALEFNNSSFTISRRGSSSNCRDLADYCARYGTPVVVGSDAHIAQGVGEFAEALQALVDAGVRPEQIVNRTLASTLLFLGLDH